METLERNVGDVIETFLLFVLFGFCTGNQFCKSAMVELDNLLPLIALK